MLFKSIQPLNLRILSRKVFEFPSFICMMPFCVQRVLFFCHFLFDFDISHFNNVPVFSGYIGVYSLRASFNFFDKRVNLLLQYGLEYLQSVFCGIEFSQTPLTRHISVERAFVGASVIMLSMFPIIFSSCILISSQFAILKFSTHRLTYHISQEYLYQIEQANNLALEHQRRIR